MKYFTGFELFLEKNSKAKVSIYRLFNPGGDDLND